MFKLSTIFRRGHRAARESDFGRRFGWFVERHGEVIGELDYLGWCADLQFWHGYRVTWRSPEDAATDPDDWIARRLVLRNRRYTDVVVESFLTASGFEEDQITVRGASVSLERIRQGDRM
ncbi:hypothetical protein [Luteolibacter sp. LG18]|uniref:hypothetical protein n=1 Tax=Luteolibacter sp. LG18 TaxID=2819286 RepID=UPI0030C76C90